MEKEIMEWKKIENFKSLAENLIVATSFQFLWLVEGVIGGLTVALHVNIAR